MSTISDNFEIINQRKQAAKSANNIANSSNHLSDLENQANVNKFRNDYSEYFGFYNLYINGIYTY